MSTARNRIFAAAALPVACLLLLRLGWSFDGLYGQDAHEYFRYARALMDWLGGGPPPGDYFWSPNYPLLGALAGFCCGGDAIWGLQLVSLASALGAAWFGCRIMLLWWPEEQREVERWTFLALVSGPAMLKFGLLGMSDMTAALGVMGAWLGAVRFGHSGGNARGALWSAAFWAAWAIGARYAVAPLLLPAGLWVLYHLRGRRVGQVLAALALAALPLLPYAILKWATPTAFVQHEWLARWSPVHFFQSAFAHVDGDQNYPFPNLVYAAYSWMHPAYWPLALLLVPFARARDWRIGGSILMAATVLLYGLFLAGIPFQNLRFHLPAYPLVAVLAFPVWLRLARWAEERFGEALFHFICILFFGVQLLFFGLSLRSPVGLSQTERRLAEALVQTGAPVAYVYYVDGGVRTRGYTGEIRNLWFPQDTPFTAGAAVLFNERQFAPLFNGRPIGQNFAALKAQRPDTVAVWPDGWVLLRMREREKE